MPKNQRLFSGGVVMCDAVGNMSDKNYELLFRAALSVGPGR